MKQMKNLTYRNLMAAIRRIEAKGYDFKESEQMARRIFEEFQAQPTGVSIEERTNRIMSKEEWIREYGC